MLNKGNPPQLQQNKTARRLNVLFFILNKDIANSWNGLPYALITEENFCTCSVDFATIFSHFRMWTALS